MTTMERKFYERHLLLPELGETGQEKLKNASVLVVGCGGLGCPVLTYLNSAGIGRIGMIDPDVVIESNLHRQILYSFDDIGRLKVNAAKENLCRHNPYNIKEIYPYLLDITNAEKIIGQYDLIIDGSDNFSTRYLINDTCVRLNKTFIYGSVAGFEGQMSVLNHRRGITYRCLYPEPDNKNYFDNPVAGVTGIIPGLIGILMATETIKIITGIGNILSGKLLVYNALTLTFKIYNIDHEERK